MHLLPATVEERDGQATLRYRYASSSRPEIAGDVWFRVPASHRDWLATGPEAGLAAVCFAAMALGEPLVVNEPVSPQFRYGLRQVIEFFALWLPRLRAVDLVAPDGGEVVSRAGDAVVGFFSSGVDSFHTLYDHLGDAQPVAPFRLSHLLFVHGFDIPLDDPSYADIAGEVATLAAGWRLDLLSLATNVRRLLDPLVPWVTTHGAALAAAALALGRRTRTAIVPSTNRHSRLFSPCGSNPLTDPSFSTETLRIVHHGCHRSRIEKIVEIAHRAEPPAHLRVCWQNRPGLRNCGRCAKCLKVMMVLALEGVLDRFTTFPPLPPWDAIDASCFAPLDLDKYGAELSYPEELHALARRRGDETAATAIARRRPEAQPVAG